VGQPGGGGGRPGGGGGGEGGGRPSGGVDRLGGDHDRAVPGGRPGVVIGPGSGLRLSP